MVVVIIATASRKISLFFIRHGIVPEGDKEIYDYSFEVLISTVLNFIAIIAIAIISGHIVDTMFFLLGLLPIRLTGGGYHAKTHFRCFLTLMVIYSIFILSLTVLNPSLLFIVCICLFSVFAVYLLAPVDSKNKRLTVEEKKRLKSVSRILISVEVGLILILSFSSIAVHGMLCASIGVFIGSLTIIVARILDIFQTKHEGR